MGGPPAPRALRRRRGRVVWSCCFVAAALPAAAAWAWCCGLPAPPPAVAAGGAAGASVRRRLLSTAPSAAPSAATVTVTQLPRPADESKGMQLIPDAFTDEQLESPLLALYIIGILYMFLALAIVCDDYFVPALEGLAEKLQLSDDVAGATFMAAGGSAPELFTSLIGTLLVESNVGFGTIVGSAVFNVLFVIGACAIATKGMVPGGLPLTWYPLFRDSIFYGVDLVLLTVFFQTGTTGGQHIEWWEALILLIMYLAYVLFMRRNERFQAVLFAKLGISIPGSEEEQKVPISSAAPELANGAQSTIKTEKDEKNTAPMDEVVSPPVAAAAQPAAAPGGPGARSSTGSKSAWETPSPQRRPANGVTGSANGVDPSPPTVALSAPPPAKSDPPAPPAAQPGNPLQPHGGGAGGPHVTLPPDAEGGRQRRRSSPAIQKFNKVTTTVLAGVQVASQFRREVSVKKIQREAAKSGRQDRSGNRPTPIIEASRNADSGDAPSPLVMPPARRDAPGPSVPGAIPVKSPRYSAAEEPPPAKEGGGGDDDDDDDDERWSPKWPSGSPADKVKFLLLFPLNFPMWATLPDCTDESKKLVPKYFLGGFGGSIAWIAVFSYLMVWWAEKTGDVIGIPSEVMGLTVLAAGTSVPDLITSVVVARKGFGDMAVSSSIGSNIFDVAFGLPFPWLLRGIFWGPVAVTSNSLGSSVILLFAMLLCTIAAIAGFGWRLNQGLGAICFALYCVFVTITLCIEFQVGGMTGIQF